MHKTYKALFEDAEKVWQIACSMIKEKDVIGVGIEVNINLAIGAIYAKQIRLFISIFTLCKKGLSSEAKILLRAMFESFLNLKFINDSPDKSEKCRQLLLWGFACHSKQMRAIGENDPKWNEVLTKQSQQIKPFKDKYGKGKWKMFEKCGPSMKNVADLSNDLGFKTEYDYIYRTGSSAIHSTDLPEFIILNESGIQLNISPNDIWIKPVGAASIIMLYRSMECINDVLKINKNDEISQLKEIAEKITRLLAE